MARYALKGLVRGHHVMTEIVFEAEDDASAWDGADALALPDGFVTCQLVEKAGRSERNVPPSFEAIAGVITSLKI